MLTPILSKFTNESCPNKYNKNLQKKLQSNYLKHVRGAISSIYTSAPLVSSLDMDYWCSVFGTKGARVNTGYGTPNMF